jgi:hypothetical protein
VNSHSRFQLTLQITKRSSCFRLSSGMVSFELCYAGCFRFFTATKGIQVRLLDMKDLPGEDSQLVADFITQILAKHGLKWENLVSFCADNAPVNFGGPQMQGPNNVFKKLIERKKNLIPVGCPAHIFHNSAQKGADRLPLDIETVVFKLASFFKGSTSRHEQFKEVCDFLEVWTFFPSSI